MTLLAFDGMKRWYVRWPLGTPLSRLDRLVVRILTDVQSLLLNVLFC
jgi:hypothetical protein